MEIIILIVLLILTNISSYNLGIKSEYKKTDWHIRNRIVRTRNEFNDGFKNGIEYVIGESMFELLKPGMVNTVQFEYNEEGKIIGIKSQITT